MKISNLKISNFKAIKRLEVSNLGDVVVIAGPNGCGKSCILDAIRFLKSVYAGYRQQNEWHHFFSEFQLDINNADEVKRVFFDRSEPVRISADFILSDKERDYAKANARQIIYKNFAGQTFGLRESSFLNPATLGQAHPDNAKKIEEATNYYTRLIVEGLEKREQNAELTLDQTPSIKVGDNLVLQFVFSIYDPVHIGIIDYHSANRTYQRERLGGINVNIEETSQRLAQHALYNWQNKYTNIKSELAAAYIRDLFVERAGGSISKVPSILSTMKELFEHFLPGKRFEGPMPGASGELTFPIKLDGGGEHDIDDLSSGEKELVYGYLRLRNVSPTNSIILLDEPELHLNPRLVLGLPNFYRKHLGLDLNNQLWMTTHSDAFLRDAYKGGGFTIFHMSPTNTIGQNENQAAPISAEDAVNRAVVDLVGDIAAFRPGNVIVIFESSENANFDAAMTKRLFPDFAEIINTLSGDNKFGVKQLYSALNKAVAQMALPYKIYAITDRDSEPEERPVLARAFNWDVYHIENYLLHEDFIAKVMQDNPSYAKQPKDMSISEALKQCAKDSLSQLVEHKMRSAINNRLIKSLDLGFDPSITDLSAGFGEAMQRIGSRVQDLRDRTFNLDALRTLSASIEKELSESLKTEEWRSTFRGRDVLRRFSGKYLSGLPYEAFRDAILARMGDAGHRPAGMKEVIEKIGKDSGAFPKRS